MINKIASILLICAGLGAAQGVLACSCTGRSVSELTFDSDDVYVAEVTSVRRLTLKPTHNGPATYEIEVRPLLLLKGRAPESIRLTYTTTYHDKSLVLAAAEGEMVPHLVTSCDTGYDVGTTFLFMLKRQEPITSVSMCSQRVIENPKPELIRGIRELLP